MLSASRDTRTTGHGDDTAAIALCALRNLNRAVAVIDPGGRILFENSTFSELFAGEAWVAELLASISPAADGVDRAGPREICRRDGRIFGVEIVRIPQGLLVTAEDISGRVAETVRTTELARTDPITCLGNRLMFRERLTALLAAPDQAASAAAVLILGSYRFFETAMDEQMQAHRALELDFRRALALREFAIVYQPQLNLGSKRITGFEALLRWHNPKRGLVSPADFIPLAEEIGLIVPIGEWVIRTACSEAAGWPQPLSVAVNVSAVQFGSPNLVSTVLSALAESGLDPRRLELEITESVLLGDHRAALDVLLKVRELGVRVSMDDFGTGYSSLSYLRSFPFDKIKIDQSFVRGQSDDPSGMAIVRAIAGLGRSLGMTTLAEGVETEEQLARVAADGCTDVQGYLISRPLPPERIGEFLRSHTECAAPGDR